MPASPPRVGTILGGNTSLLPPGLPKRRTPSHSVYSLVGAVWPLLPGLLGVGERATTNCWLLSIKSYSPRCVPLFSTYPHKGKGSLLSGTMLSLAWQASGPICYVTGKIPALQLCWRR